MKANCFTALQAGLAIPFELARQAHGQIVKQGWLPDSILECRNFERHLSALEKLTLGYFARSI